MLIGTTLTLFPIFDIPVFWPILLLYWLVLLFITMRRQIRHMIKYRYIPFSTGKKVCDAELTTLCEVVQALVSTNDKIWIAFAALYRVRVRDKTTSQVRSAIGPGCVSHSSRQSVCKLMCKTEIDSLCD